MDMAAARCEAMESVDKVIDWMDYQCTPPLSPRRGRCPHVGLDGAGGLLSESDRLPHGTTTHLLLQDKVSGHGLPQLLDAPGALCNSEL